MNHRKAGLLVAAIPLLAITVLAEHDGRRPEREFRADLRGRNEAPLTLSAGRGSLELTVNEMDTSVHFVLQYEGLTTPVTQAHIHVGQKNVNGGVTVFFCGGTTRPPCPASPATVEGDFMATDVLPLTTQQLEAGNLAKLLRAIRAGQTYGNVHTQTSPGGEIRGQIKADRDHDEDDDK
jgi:CHRD domain-containing protein